MKQGDILIYQSNEEYSYAVYENDILVDVITGEILLIEDKNVIGNTKDHANFINDLQILYERDGVLPYIPAINVMRTSLPFWSINCLCCGYEAWSILFVATCPKCSELAACNFNNSG